MHLSFEEIRRVIKTEELAKFFVVTEEQDFLNRHLSPLDVIECIGGGSSRTNLERVETLITKLIQHESRDFYDQFVEYFLKKCLEYKKVYFSLKYGIAELKQDIWTQTTCCDVVLSSPVVDTGNVKKEEWMESKILTSGNSFEPPSSESAAQPELSLKMDKDITKENPYSYKSAPAKSRLFMNIENQKKSQEPAEPDVQAESSSCVVCLKKFKSISLLRRHTLSHTDQNRFPREQSNKLLKNSCDTSSHMQVHTDPQLSPPKRNSIATNSVDPLRRKSLKSQSVLRGKRPFSYKVCGENYSQRSALSDRMMTHIVHSVKKFRCNLCPETYSRAEQLASHVNTHIIRGSYDDIKPPYGTMWPDMHGSL